MQFPFRAGLALVMAGAWAGTGLGHAAQGEVDEFELRGFSIYDTQAAKALAGAPGIMSARWAGPNRDFSAAMARLERELAGHSNRRAAFVSVLALAWPGGEAHCFEGRIKGTLVFPPRGSHGFGYDPVFVPDGYDITFGEMDPAEKTAISHRAVAFRKLLAAFEAKAPA